MPHYHASSGTARLALHGGELGFNEPRQRGPRRGGDAHVFDFPADVNRGPAYSALRNHERAHENSDEESIAHHAAQRLDIEKIAVKSGNRGS